MSLLRQRAARLLAIWGAALRRHQLDLPNSALDGGLLCPACARIHGRSGDAVLPFLHLAATTGESGWLEAARRIRAWSAATVERADGRVLNDVTVNAWEGITVFSALALGRSLARHGSLLTGSERDTWLERLRAEAGWVARTFTLATANINYPASACACLALAAGLCGEAAWMERARCLAEQVAGRFTPEGFLHGEGPALPSHRGLPSVDLGYDVEESLPNLAEYAELAGDQTMAACLRRAAPAHLAFALEDGGWDCTWCSRMFKWTWWGSRTSDGALPWLLRLANEDPRAAAMVEAQLSQFEACTVEGLLHGGPHLAEQGEPACIHHTINHALGLACALDLPEQLWVACDGAAWPEPDRPRLWQDLATWTATCAGWRATCTASDVLYRGPGSAGHPSGGSLSLLHHARLGPVLCASLGRYEQVEPHNQVPARDHLQAFCLSPRVELERIHENSRNENIPRAAWRTRACGGERTLQR